MPPNTPTSMEPLSARIPSDLYLWLARLPVEGASTNSDKLRVLLGQLKKQHDGSMDYVTAYAWAKELTHTLRDALVRIEGPMGRHSEVMSVLLEHLTSALALMMSQVPQNIEEAAKLEDTLVRRSFALFEGLLRQAATGSSAAYQPNVVEQHMGGTITLAKNILHLKGIY